MNLIVKTLKFLVVLFFAFGLFTVSAKNVSAACPDPVLTITSHTNHPDTVTFHFQIKNCAAAPAARTYNLSADLPGGANSGWKINFTGNKVNAQDQITVGKDATVNFDGTINPPAKATVGAHAVKVIAKNANGKDVVNFNYIVTNECNLVNPTLTSPDKDKTAAAGTVLTYTINVKNNSVKCDPADFKLTTDAPNNWNVDFVPNAISNLKSGLSDSVQVKIKSPAGATANKVVTVTVENKTKPGNKKTFALNYNIQTTGGTCTGSNLNPHFECVNNACTSVAACGVNSGGCTSASGTCGTNTCTGTGNSNPHFECQNNSCVKVDACGGNTGGCTAEGGSCGSTSGGDKFNLDVVLDLDTIGTTGTNRVPTFASSNKTPGHPDREAKIEIFTLNNEKLGESHATVTYQSDETQANYGKFVGSLELQNGVGYDLPLGNYIVKISVPGFLTKQIPGTVSISPAIQHNVIPSVNLTNGDISGNNSLGIEDYNLFISCSIFAKTDADKAACNANAQYKLNSDLNDDGSVDQIDYIYFLQEFAVQNGD